MDWAPLVRQLKSFGVDPIVGAPGLVVNCPDCSYQSLHWYDRVGDVRRSTEVARDDLRYHRYAWHGDIDAQEQVRDEIQRTVTASLAPLPYVTRQLYWNNTPIVWQTGTWGGK